MRDELNVELVLRTDYASCLESYMPFAHKKQRQGYWIKYDSNSTCIWSIYLSVDSIFQSSWFQSWFLW